MSKSTKQKAPEPKGDKNNNKSSHNVIRSVTDSVTRIGADDAFIVTITVLGIGALVARVDAIDVVLVVACLTVCFLAIKLFSMRTEERRLRLEIERLRLDRGRNLLEDKDEPKKLPTRTGEPS